MIQLIKNVQFKNKLYTGFTSVQVKSVNPNRSELNKLLGRVDSEDDKGIVYLGEDKEGNARLRLVFWLHDLKLDKYFPYSFNLLNKERTNNAGNKTQYINSVCMTSWANSQVTLQNWFTCFMDKDKCIIGPKTFRPALIGEEELGILLRSWLGRLSWYDKDTTVEINTEKLFQGDYSELQELIDSDFDTPFTILLGVKTDVNESDKLYQQVYGKAFLPAAYMNHINNGFDFPTEYGKKVWVKFKKDLEGDFGPKFFYKLTPVKKYAHQEDLTIIYNLVPEIN